MQAVVKDRSGVDFHYIIYIIKIYIYLIVKQK